MKFYNAALAVWVVSGIASGAPSWNTSAPEATFVFHRAPIHPACLDNEEAKEGDKIDLVACTASGRKNDRSVQHKNGEFSAEARVQNGMRTIFASYRVLANRGTTFVVQSRASGGGTGIFDTIQIVELAGNRLVIRKFVTGGDRCVGGIQSATVTSNHLRYSNNLTAYYVIANPGETLSGRYAELDSGAVTCVATNNSEYDLDSGKEQQVSVALTGDWYTSNSQPTPLEAGNGDDVNSCFDRLYNSYFARKETVLRPPALAAFRKKFFATCKK